MATNESYMQQCGEEIARLRTLRELSRAKLIGRLYDELDLDDLDSSYESISESWLKRLENGKMVKLSRTMLDAICRALHCTSRERARVLLLADRNPLTSEKMPDAVAELLTRAMLQLYDQGYTMLEDMVVQRDVSQLSETEIIEIMATVLEMLARRAQRK